MEIFRVIYSAQSQFKEPAIVRKRTSLELHYIQLVRINYVVNNIYCTAFLNECRLKRAPPESRLYL